MKEDNHRDAHLPASGKKVAETDGRTLEFLCRGTADIMRKMAPPVKKSSRWPKVSGSMLLQSSRAKALAKAGPTIAYA
jgi:hypothetical protein